MSDNEIKLQFKQLKQLPWRQFSNDTLQDSKNYEFFAPDVYSGTTKTEKLFEEALGSTTDFVPFIWGALRVILSSRKKNETRDPLKVYIFAIDSPTMLPDCKAYKVHKWHIIEDQAMSENEKYSYFETTKFFVALRHKWTEADSCFLLLYRKPPEEDNS